MWFLYVSVGFDLAKLWAKNIFFMFGDFNQIFHYEFSLGLYPPRGSGSSISGEWKSPNRSHFLHLSKIQFFSQETTWSGCLVCNNGFSWWTKIATPGTAHGISGKKISARVYFAQANNCKFTKARVLFQFEHDKTWRNKKGTSNSCLSHTYGCKEPIFQLQVAF